MHVCAHAGVCACMFVHVYMCVRKTRMTEFETERGGGIKEGKEERGGLKRGRRGKERWAGKIHVLKSMVHMSFIF